MNYLLTIADVQGLDIYAVGDQRLLRHWFLDVLEPISYRDLIGYAASQMLWNADAFREIKCVLPMCDVSSVKTYLGDDAIIGLEQLAESLGCAEVTALIETRKYFISIKDGACNIAEKADIYNRPVTLFSEFANRKLMEIGCREMLEGTLQYANTKTFFLNLIEHMPERFEVLAVPVFASSGSKPLTCDRGFVEIGMKEACGGDILGNTFEKLLLRSLACDDKRPDMVLVYNAFLKKKLFI